jgi:hypothetical protein
MWWYHALGYTLTHVSVASEKGQTTKAVRCEQCGRSYVYELKRTGEGSANTLFGGGYTVAAQRAAENLQQSLDVGIELVPCPACGWYQSSMFPKARRLHGRWMLNLGACLTIGLIPVTIIGGLINHINEEKGNASIPWPIFVGGLVVLFILGIGMFVGKFVFAGAYDPNDRDVEARRQLGQSRAILLSEQEEMDQEAPQEWEPDEL